MLARVTVTRGDKDTRHQVQVRRGETEIFNLVEEIIELKYKKVLPYTLSSKYYECAP